MKGSENMYKVTIEKDGKAIRVVDKMANVMLTGEQENSAMQIVEGECSPATSLGLLDLLKYSILKRM